MVERQALERYLPPSVVEKVLANPNEMHLGGENMHVTILFSDIRGLLACRNTWSLTPSSNSSMRTSPR